jgi:hypothetical protein
VIGSPQWETLTSSVTHFEIFAEDPQKPVEF